MAEVIRPSTVTNLEVTQSVAYLFDPAEKHYRWVRWVNASINKHFTDELRYYPLYLEGDERTLQDKAEFFELRIDGPFILQPQKGFWFLDVEINILVQTHMSDKQLYNIQNAVGQAVRAFKNVICVYNYDDNILLGTLHLQRRLDETVDVNNFGIIKEDTRITQTTIEGHYRMEVE
jgi:hypothetical protein